MEDLSKRIAGLSLEKLDLFLHRLNQQSETAAPEETIPRRSESDSFLPLSFAQQRLWFLDQLKPGSNAYNIGGAIRLDGVLNASALERSLGEIIRRHEILRTTFSTVAGKPVQIIAPASEFRLPVIDLRPLGESQREEEALRLAIAEARQPFDLQEGPLFRSTLIRLDEYEHILLLTMHHIISDGWSIGIIIEELTSLYGSFSTGKSASLSDLSIQYADFALWQRKYLQEESLDAMLSYWKKQLDGAPSVIELPTDRPRPPVQSFQGAAASFAVSKQVSETLKRLSNREGATLFMTLLAAFETLLSRYTGQKDLLIGTPIAGRNRVEVEKLIGLFVNTLIIRADTSGDPSFCELLGRVREITLEAYSHQNLPFEKLVDELHPERSLSHTPLVQVVFVLQNVPMPNFELAGLKLSQIEVESGTTKFDLTLTMTDEEGGLRGFVEYNTDLFDSETIARLISNFQTLLEGIADNPHRRLSELPLLTETEQLLLLTGWNEQDADFSAYDCLHQLFEKQAETIPDSIAVTCGDRGLSYQQLNERANQLAHHLRDSGVGPETLVCICLDRSIEMIVGLLGVLKAGGTYVPLDPAYPKERLAYMLEDTRAPVLLTSREQMEKLPPYTGLIVCLDTDWPDIARLSGDNPINQARPLDPAYVIYTSGSTGNPKGAVVTHRNVARLFEATRRWFDFGEKDVWTLFHSLAFDFSVWEIWGALLHGGRLVVVPYLVSRTPDAFYELLVEEGVTVLNQTPSAFRQLMEAEERETRELALRLVIFGGEALDIGSLKSWFDRHGDRTPEMINMYGITETTVHVTYRRITKADVREGAGSYVGKAIPDLRVYVLDEHLQLAPIGAAGELYVGGGGVARGYLNRTDLTADRFVPNPFVAQAGERLYKTGDLARYLRNGDIEYLGRIDHQVKIRGFRIELGEIESFLSQCPGVQEAVVLAREDESGDKRLIAYVVADQKQKVTGSQLRGFLIEKLPDYMTPSTFVTLERLPLTPNGKVDRRSLLASGPERLEPEETFAAPRTWIEEALAQTWAQALGLARVGIHDNFFALGGDSILSVRMISLARERGLNFSIEQLFRHQTICELACDFKNGDGPSASLKTEPFSLISEDDRAKLPDDVEDAYPLTMGQAGLLYQMEMAPSLSVYHNVDSMSFRVSRFDADALQNAVDCVVARHPILRTSFDLSNFSEPLQLVHETARLRVEVEDLRCLSPSEQEETLQTLVEREKRHRFDLSKAPLLRFRIHRLTDEIFEFTQTESHPIHDGWSMNSMLVEIFKQYAAMLDGHILAEEPPASSFRDFVLLEREALRSEESQRYWDRKLSDFTALKLPAQDARPDELQTHLYPVPVSSECLERLNQLAREAAVPLKSVLLAAHVKALSVICGETDVLTGLVTHGRPEEVGGERARGFFLNTIPFRMKLREGAWIELAREAFKFEMESLPHRRYPLGELQKKYGRQAIIETAFNFINFHVLDELPAGEVELLGVSHSVNQTHFALSATFSLNQRYWGSYFEDAPMVIVLQYDPTRLGREFVETVGEYYTNILDQMAADPRGHHDSRCFLTAAEQQRLLVEWRDTAADYSRDKCIHHLFEEQVERAPEAVAVTFEGEQLTYGELNRRANQLAHYLRSHGVGPETLVGICVDRSIDMIVGLLGILKAGGAYVPLDPAYPKERLDFLVKDAGMKVLVTQEKLSGVIAEFDGKTVCLDADALARQDDDNPADGVGARNLAYVIYTSGSTGRPKGALIEHKGLCNLSQEQRRSFGLSAGSRVLQFSSLNFDASIFEIVMALSAGATLCLAPKESLMPGSSLVEFLRRREVNLVTLPPSALIVTPQDDLPSLHTITVAGEACPGELAARWANGRRFFNLYGPTEATIWATMERCEEDTQKPSIGRPIANTGVYILDAFLHPAPVGVAGELHISGEGLARGYLNRADLTSEKFIPNPFSDQPGARLYKTGDLAAYLPDGRIDFLGRLDDQVKILGYRIEPGEVEAALLQHPFVEEAAVVSRQIISGERMLVAYTVAKKQIGPVELRNYLREKIPEYLLPSAFVALDHLPRNPNGKLDRRALPEPEQARPELETVYEAPRTEAERMIASIWQDVLQIEKVGIQDNFFDLGGHSIRLIQAHSRMQEVFDYKIPLVELFQHPTVSALALRLTQHAEQPSLEQSRERAEIRRESIEQKRQIRKRRRGTASHE